MFAIPTSSTLKVTVDTTSDGYVAQDGDTPAGQKTFALPFISTSAVIQSTQSGTTPFDGIQAFVESLFNDVLGASVPDFKVTTDFTASL